MRNIFWTLDFPPEFDEHFTSPLGEVVYQKIDADFSACCGECVFRDFECEERIGCGVNGVSACYKPAELREKIASLKN